MRLSVYGQDGFTVGIIQFVGGEEAAVINRLKSMEPGTLKKLVSKALGSEVKSLALAFGKLVHGDQHLDMAYLRVSTADNSEYLLEIYEESGTAITNTSVPEAYENIAKILREISPLIKTPKPRLIGI